MSRRTVYAFERRDFLALKQIARSAQLTPGAQTMAPGVPLPAGPSGSWIVRADGSITGATYSTDITPGSGSAIIQTLNSSGKLVPHTTDAAGTVSRTIKSLLPHALPDGATLLATRTLDQNLWVTTWLDMPALFCRFTAGAAFDTSDASVSGTIQTLIGFGKSPASTSATFNNLLTATASTYLFEATASGKAGLAYYTGSGTTWQIVQMECPT